MKINGKIYEAPSLNFESMCKLEDWGISVSDLSRRPLACLSGFVALAIGGNLASGRAEINAHIENGGNLDELADELNKAVEDSSFFRDRAKKETV